MKKSFDIEIQTYQAATFVSIVQADGWISITRADEISGVSFQTAPDKIIIDLYCPSLVTLTANNAWEWNKVKDLLDLVLPVPKVMKWHKKKFPGHPCYQDYSKDP